MTEIYWGKTKVILAEAGVSGNIVEIEGEKFYRIGNYDRMPPFLISVVSSSNHWMFVSSTGGLSCGRGNPDNALFPYETDDQIHDSVAYTGPRTCLLVEKDGKTWLWKPFSVEVAVYGTQRNLYKSLVGNRLIFEETNHDLGLVFSHCWSTSDRFGFVKATTVRNTGDEKVSVQVLDGFQNILPPGVSREMQSGRSTLVDAYKKCETDVATGVGIYSLSSIPMDRAEPCESLQASVAWCLGLENPAILLSGKQTAAFCSGLNVSRELEMKGQRGAYFAEAGFTLAPNAKKDWYLLADIGLGPSDLPLLLNSIARGINPGEIDDDVDAGTRRLRQLVGSADGFQFTSDELESGRHFANTLFNIMRGGTFTDEYRIHHRDFLAFISSWNAPLLEKFSSLLGTQADPLDRSSLFKAIGLSGDPHMKRLALEYLPLTFSRRHGDPSRPWNNFNIDIKNVDGTEKLHYQGNWRDIFQNWEALAISYPEFIDSFIAKFVNASTVDGFNPYRIGSDGIDWEEMDPNDEWSNIGYWGDHQANYLSSLLEFSQRYFPERIAQLLDQDLFVYADVPYRLKNYQALLENPRDSIEFDWEHARQVAHRVTGIGADGKLLTLPSGTIYRVNLLEKLLVSALSKLGNFVPGGGIWMNTQRPEWNDANNALAGYGLSMVTLSYLRRQLKSVVYLANKAATETFLISSGILEFLRGIQQLLGETMEAIGETTTVEGRKVFMDRIGALASDYRKLVYGGISGNRKVLDKDELLTFLNTALVHLDFTLGLGRRQDGLFHSYNVIQFGVSGFRVKHLPEMLEGQVAVLNSGYLDPRESLALMDGLRNSALYCSVRNSYLLYPDKELPPFLDRNVIPKPVVDNSPLLLRELTSGRRDFVEQDVHGKVHFNGTFRSVVDLNMAIERAGNISREEKAEWCELYETVFKHHEFTGRSSAMYKYEGLGCIYWHMVSKLLLAVSGSLNDAREAGADAPVLKGLMDHFDNVRHGLGLHKSPANYGAIPLDPYSHTPGFAGAQQPGMTGQVKEDVITRFRELGVVVRDGLVSFDPYLLSRAEFVPEAGCWQFSLGESPQEEMLEAGSMAFSLCGTPVIYRLAEKGSIQVFADDERNGEVKQGASLGAAWSRSLFRRDKRIRKIVLNIPEASLR